MSKIVFERLVTGFGPLTSSLFVASEDIESIGIVEGQTYRVNISAWYKGKVPSFFVNVFGGHVQWQDKKVEMLSKAKAKIQFKSGFFTASDGRKGVAKLIHWIEQATLKCQDLDGRTIGGLNFDELLRMTQPGNVDYHWQAWMASLPSNIYKSLGMRWCGKPAGKAPTKLSDIVDMINTWTPRFETQPMFHVGMEDTRGAVPGSTYSGQRYPSASTMSPTSPHGSAAPAAAPAAAVAPLNTNKPKGPISDLQSQLAELTDRANKYDEMFPKFNELFERNVKLEKDIEDLRNKPSVTIVTGPKFTPSGKVDIAGEEIDGFHSLTAAGAWSVPEIDQTYCLAGWRSSFECADLQVPYNIGHVMQTILAGSPTRLIGPPATGKTSGITQACAHLNIPCHVVQCGKGMTEYTLLGEQTIDGGNVVWKDGILPRLFRDVQSGLPCILVLDEGDHLPVAIQSILHAVLEGRVLDLPNGEKITVPDEIIVVMTANTYGTGDITGRHASAQISDDAFLSRWVRTFTVDYLDASMERELLMSFGVPSGMIDNLMQFVTGTRDQARKIDRGEISDGIRTPVTLRSLIPFAQEIGQGGDPLRAFCSSVMGQFSPDEAPKVRELLRTCMDW